MKLSQRLPLELEAAFELMNSPSRLFEELALDRSPPIDLHACV